VVCLLLIDIFKALWIPDCIEAKFDLESRQTLRFSECVMPDMIRHPVFSNMFWIPAGVHPEKLEGPE